MFVHLEAKQLNLHMGVERCSVVKYDSTDFDFILPIFSEFIYIHMYGFIDIRVMVCEIKYLSRFEEGKCTLLIKDGEILKQ